MTTTSKTRTGVSSPVVIAMVFAALVIVSWAAFEARSIYNAGFAFGFSLSLAAIVWAIVYFTFIRTRAPKTGLACFAILFGVALATNFTLLSVQKSRARSSANHTLVEKVRFENGGAARADGPPAGDVERGERVLAEYRADLSQLNKNYQAEM